MYEEGAKSLIQGWTKHFATGASGTEGTIMLMIMTWMMGITFSHILLLLSFITKTVSKMGRIILLLISYSIYKIA